MSKFKFAFSFIALIIAFAAAFAFSPRPVSSTSPNADYWLKFDCNQSGQVYTGGPNRTINVPTGCLVNGTTFCARQYASTDLELDPNFPGQQIYRLKAGATPINTVYCP